MGSFPVAGAAAAVGIGASPSNDAAHSNDAWTSLANRARLAGFQDPWTRTVGRPSAEGSGGSLSNSTDAAGLANAASAPDTSTRERSRGKGWPNAQGAPPYRPRLARRPDRSSSEK